MSTTVYTTHASQDRDETLVYATRGVVEQLLAGVNKGTDHAALANLAGAQEALIDLWLEPATDKVHDVAKRDFDYHEDVEVAINGSGTNRIDLSLYGLTPLIDVSKVEVEDSTLDEVSYRVSKDGWIQYSGQQVSVTEGFKTPLSRVLFPEGALNVKVTATWGYRNVPAKIVMAANLFAACYVLAFVEAFDSNTDDDIPGGDLSWRMGDMQITQRAGESRYGKFMKRLYGWAEGFARKYRPPLRMALVKPEPRIPFADEYWRKEA